MEEMNKFLEFRGTWRNYQKRVLKNANAYLEDGKIHIVAAPGSGKTTLGIELISRVGKPTLILAPSIVIREQWEQRIVEAFLMEGLKPEDYISQDLKNPSVITIATYQALHSAMTKLAGKLQVGDSDEETDDEVVEDNESEETVDFTNFDLVKQLKKIGVEVLCLDECHHLRNEWWKALEEFQKAMGDITTIALTATPPYDSTPAMWDRYMSICGEIDEEITTPELVKEGSLCPHQDYVYFSYPTKEELQTIRDFEDRRDDMIENLLNDSQFGQIILSHTFIQGGESDDTMLEEPKYLASLLIYLQNAGLHYPDRLRNLLCVKTLPAMEPKWMEILLQKLLFDDTDRFTCDETYFDSLVKHMKADGFVERRKVILSNSTAIEKLMVNSKGKADSVVTIAGSEYDALGNDLRMVILTDYIRKEYMKKLGTDESEKTPMLGVLPFFEYLRVRFANDETKPALGVLCGTVVIIPTAAKARLVQLLGDSVEVTFTKAGQLSEDEYLLVSVKGKQHILTSVVTDIFREGYINILIGTKSLLGEGWDSPCINSLILASFVGSFMLSNQMRGRAIRVFKDDPNKTGNIWNLVCIKPEENIVQIGGFKPKADYSADFDMLRHRMEHFLGLHYEMNTIENGIERMSIIKPPFTRARINDINNEMLELSRERHLLKERWDNALTVYDRPEVVQETVVPDRLVSVAVFQEGVKEFIVSMFLYMLTRFTYRMDFDVALVVMLVVAATTELFFAAPRLFMAFSPYRRLKTISEQILKALVEGNLLEDSRCKVEVVDESPTVHGAYLKGGTGRDKALFAKCVTEFFGEIDNQRYLLVNKKILWGKNDFYVVPEIFAKNKESAAVFANCMKKYLRKYNLVYTRNEEGRRILLKGRVHAFANMEDRIMNKKKVKNALE